MKTLKNTLLITMALLNLTAFAKMGQSTDEVWKHHIEAWNNRDVAQILEDYDSASVIIVGNTVYRGKNEISDLFHTLFRVFDQAEEHVIDEATIIGKVVYITWRAKISGHDYPFGTDTFVIEHGKITYQTITSDPNLLKEGKASE